jgi:hypothetical protein
MMIFDLICVRGHGFEGWFDGLSDLEEQISAKKLSCPVCGHLEVSRRPSTFGLIKSRSVGNSPGSGNPNDEEARLDSEEDREGSFLKNLELLSRKLQTDFADVGVNFTSEALKMHYGAAPRRNIRGHSTSREEKILREEGVEFFKLPMLVRKNGA